MDMNTPDDVTQRQRLTKPEDLKPSDDELFLSVGQTCITQGDSAQLLDFIRDHKNQDVVRSLGCGLLGLLTNEAVKKDGDPGHCQDAINHIIQICSATEVLNVLLQQVEESDPGVIADTITLLTKPIQTALLMLDDLKPEHLNLVLDALHRQICKLPVPYLCKQEDEDEHGFCRCCTTLLTFVQPFVQEIKNHDARGPPRSSYHARLRSVLLKFCMRILREPLLEAQFEKGPDDTSRTSPLRSFASGMLMILHAIHEPLPELLLYRPLRGEPEDAVDSPESRACLAYLLFVQLIAIEVFPAVFRPEFVLQCNMGHVNILLSRQDESWILKGLDLHVKSLERVLDSSLSVELLELKHFNTVPQNLIKIMTDCPIQHLRVKALLVFQLFIKKLNAEARHTFFRCVLRTSQHAGVDSVILTSIKNQVDRSSKRGQRGDWFDGALLLSLLKDVLSLPRGPETDLLNDMDRIMVSLNLLRYLLIRERNTPTGVWTELCSVAEEYVRTLRVCLSMSRSYYSSEVRRIHEDKRVKAREFKEAAGSKAIRLLMVKDEALGGMPREAQEKVLRCALVTYDLMESIVVRIEEIINDRQ